MLFISDVQYYIPLKLHKTAGSKIKITGKADTRQGKTKQTLYMGYFRSRLE